MIVNDNSGVDDSVLGNILLEVVSEEEVETMVDNDIYQNKIIHGNDK